MPSLSQRIINLPGWNGTQEMYAGYINVNASHGRNLFYWLVESAGNPDTDPLVLWVRGGLACCSGLASARRVTHALSLRLESNPAAPLIANTTDVPRHLLRRPMAAQAARDFRAACSASWGPSSPTRTAASR